MAKQGEPKFLGNPQRGIAKSSHLGIADIRNCDIHSEPGILKINEKAVARTNQVQTTTFTANAGTDEITTASGLSNNSSVADVTVAGRAVILSNSGGSLPGGLTTNTVYYLIPVSTTVYKLATSYANVAANTAINITSAGTGTHTITTIEMGRPEEECTDPSTGYSFVVDNVGRVWWQNDDTPTLWRLLDGNTRTSASGNGIFAAWGYLGVFRDSALDFADISTQTKIEDPVGQSIWSTPAAFQTGLVSATKHKAFVKDGIVYFGNGRYVGSIEELTTFVPGTAATYSYSATDLDLEQGWVVGPISELGTKLQVFASRNGQSRCFPWDPDESSWEGDYPVPGQEVYDAINILNTIYIASGLTGCIYSSLGTVASLFMQIPRGLPTTGVASQIRVRRVRYFKNRIFFAVDSAATEGVSGVWSVGLDGTGLNLEHQVSSGSYGSSSSLTIPLLHTPNDGQLHIGWQDNSSSTQGMDSVGDATSFYTSYAAYIIFEFLNVGNVRQSWNPGEIMYQLVQNLNTSEGIRLSYRTDASSSFTTIGTYDYSTLGAVMSHFDVTGINGAEMLQIKAELTGSGSSSPKFRHITIQ